MATPIYALRLPQKVQDDLAEFGRIYGSPNGRAFAREILEVVTSGDMERIKAFNARLIHGMGEQLTLKLNAATDALRAEATKAAKPANRAKAAKAAKAAKRATRKTR